jgi:hypothetical protein
MLDLPEGAEDDIDIACDRRAPTERSAPRQHPVSQGFTATLAGHSRSAGASGDGPGRRTGCVSTSTSAGPMVPDDA